MEIEIAEKAPDRVRFDHPNSVKQIHTSLLDKFIGADISDKAEPEKSDGSARITYARASAASGARARMTEDLGRIVKEVPSLWPFGRQGSKSLYR